MCSQVDDMPEEEMAGMEHMPPEERWWQVAQASLNGLRGNPACAGMPPDQIAQMAAEDADALLERRDDNG